jgi:NitT/TauT family transport system substrate-binding protein
VLFTSEAIPGEIVDVLAVNPAFAQRHPAQLRALVRTWWAAQALARAEPAASVALMAQREQVSSAAFTASEQGIRYLGPGDQERMLAADGPVAQVVSRMAKQMLAAQRIQPDVPLPKPSRRFLADP